jgi:hypothetical protein
VVPFHAHVPDNTFEPASQPPYRIVSPNDGSHAITAPARADGDVAGDSWVQVVPFQVQVSPNTVPVLSL